MSDWLMKVRLEPDNRNVSSSCKDDNSMRKVNRKMLKVISRNENEIEKKI